MRELVFNMSKTSGFKSLFTEIQHKQRMALKHTAKRITEEIQNEFKETTTEFYEEYAPRSYRRTYSTYALSDKGAKSPEVIGKDTFIGGIEVNSSYIGGNPYKADLDWVVDRTWNKGYHGSPKVKKGKKPDKQLEKKVKSFAKNNVNSIFNEEMTK